MALQSDLDPLYNSALEELNSAKLGLAEAQRRASDAETRVRLLEGLLALSSPSGEGPGQPLQHADIIDAVVSILKSHGGPLSVGDIRDELLSRSIPLPGKGEPANLISRFQRSRGRIVRVSRGLYDIQRVGGSPVLVYSDGRAVQLKPITRLGKGDECEVVLSDSSVSQIQALITVQDGGAIIGNAGDPDSIRVNGRELVNPVLLAEGDRVTIGETELTYRTVERNRLKET